MLRTYFLHPFKKKPSFIQELLGAAEVLFVRDCSHACMRLLMSFLTSAFRKLRYDDGRKLKILKWNMRTKKERTTKFFRGMNPYYCSCFWVGSKTCILNHLFLNQLNGLLPFEGHAIILHCQPNFYRNNQNFRDL